MAFRSPELAAAVHELHGAAPTPIAPRSLTAAEFLRLELPPRKRILAPWLAERASR